MKKFLLGMFLFVSFLFIPHVVDAKENVTIYLFRGSTCAHCEEALTYLNDHKDIIPDGVEFLTYEVWENKNNEKVREMVAKKVNVEEKYRSSVPLFVVGDHHIIGYNSPSDFQELIGYATKYQNDGDYKDLVKESIKELNVDVKSMNLEQIFPEPNKVVTIVVYSVFAIVLLLYYY